MDQEFRWYITFERLNQNFMKIRITLAPWCGFSGIVEGATYLDGAMGRGAAGDRLGIPLIPPGAGRAAGWGRGSGGWRNNYTT